MYLKSKIVKQDKQLAPVGICMAATCESGCYTASCSIGCKGTCTMACALNCAVNIGMQTF